jgi:fused signal recognition particle receptor
MAFGFVKKIFSFGKREVEEVPAQGKPESLDTQLGPAQPLELPHTPETPVAEEPAQPSPKPAEPDLPPPAEPTVPRPDEPGAPSAPPEQEPVREPETPPEPEPEFPPEPEPRPRPVPEVPVEVPEPPLEPAREPERPAEPEPEIPEERPAETPAPSAPPEAPPEPAPELPATEPSQPAEIPPRGEAAEATPSGPSGHLPLEEGERLPPEPSSTQEAIQEGKVEERAGIARVRVGKAVERHEPPAPVAEPAAQKQGWVQRLRHGLSRSSRELRDGISGVFTKGRLTDEAIEDLEDVLIRADLGMETALRITDGLASGRYGRQTTEADVRAIMAEEVEKVLAPVAMPLELDLSHKPHVILVVGVNGTGKTTTIGKLAAKLTDGGLSVTLAAGDTFRAAAIEQLKIWGERTGAPVVASKLGADAAGLAWDAYEKAKEAGSDVLIIDTAGRLQNRAELMAELEKIVRVLGKHDPDAPHTVLQTVDATTGQNALNQVEIFRNVAGVNGLVMTKLDGTARGGILVAIAAKHKLPVYFIGVGEQVDDLEPFSAGDFAKAIAGV